MIKTKSYKSIFLALAIFAVFGALTPTAQATSKEDIAYPVPELGNCKNEAQCKSYCDNSDNLPQCIRFAKKHNLVEGPEIAEENVERFSEAMRGGGPGGCKTQRECEAFCNREENMSTCIEFAERSGFLTGRELEEAKKVKSALDRGIKLPAGCTNKEACEAACKSPKDKETARSCFAFAKEAGLLPPDFDDERTERMFELIDRGEVDFQRMQKCEGLESGEITDAETINACLDVGEKLGFMKSGEKEIARRMLIDGGPGGCRGRQCQEVCENNPEICLNYFEEKGIALPEEAQERMREGLEQMREALSEAPEEVIECLRSEIGADIFTQIESGTIKASQMAKLGPRMGQIMQGCFMKSFGGEEGFGPQEGFEGGFPGGPGEFPGGPGEFPGGPGSTGAGMPEGVQECFEELGLQFPPRRPPSADEQQRIGECMRDKSGGPEDEQGPGHEEFGPPGGFRSERDFPDTESSPEDFEQGGFPAGGPTPEQIQQIQKEQFDAQFQKEFEKQYEQQYQQQFQEQYQKQFQQIQGQFPQGFDPSQIPQGQIPSGFGPAQNGYPAPGQPLPGGYGPQQPPSSYINPPSLLGFFAQILLGL